MSNTSFNDSEMLKYLMDKIKINPDTVQHEMEMAEHRRILQSYPNKIWQGKDGRWRAHLPDEDRTLIAKATKEQVEEAIIDYYSGVAMRSGTFYSCYCKWRKKHDIVLSDNSISKYNSDYRRYFKDTDFVKMDIKKITEEDVDVFLTSRIKDLKLGKQATKTLFEYMFNTFRSACINRVINENPMQYLQPREFFKFCTNKNKPLNIKTVPPDEMEKLYDQFYKDYAKHPEYITTYAVQFATLTGMRVGEISALRWDSVFDTYFVIDKSEKYNKLTKEYFIDGTKNEKVRAYPISQEIRDLFNRVKKAEMERGWLCEWVFANAKGRIHAPAISCCCKNKCRQVGITDRGIHAFRRTVNSMMKCNGVSSTVAASLLGHSEQVNEQYYTFDITTTEEKAKIIAEVNARMPHEHVL